MPSSTVNICVFALVLLSIQHTCHSRPQIRDKREIIKDYFTPSIFQPKEFEKGEDGKFYLKKSAHRLDSAVNYVNIENAEDESSILKNDLKTANEETLKGETEAVLVERARSEPISEMVAEIGNLGEVPSSLPYFEVENVKEAISPNPETIKTEKLEISKEKASFTPVDPKFMVPPKPDSKDEIIVKTDLPPIEEEKVDEKVTIGHIPHFYSRVIPIPTNFRIPILIPIRKISYGSVSVVPLPPAEVSDRLPLQSDDVSDRLPLPPASASDRILPFALDDIVGEGEHESASLEPAAEEKKDAEYPEANPLSIKVQLPFLSFSGLLKELTDTKKEDGEKQSKIVDVLGKKFLMQTNVVKYPTGDNGQTFVRFMSVKPLKGSDPAISKEAAAEESIKSVIKETDRKEMDEFDMKKEIDVIGMKRKELEEIDMENKEIDMENKEIDMENKEIDMKKDEIDMKEKEMEEIDMKKKEMKKIDTKKKEMEEFDMKKEMGGTDMKIEREEIDMKIEMEEMDRNVKEMEGIDLKKKEMEEIDTKNKYIGKKKKEIGAIDLEKKGIETFDIKIEEIEAEEELVGIEKAKEASLAKSPEILKVEESRINVKVDPFVSKDIVMKEIGNPEKVEEKSEDPFVKEMKMKKESESDMLERSLKSAEEEEIEKGKARAMEDKKAVIEGGILDGSFKKEMKKEMDVISKEELFFIENKKKIKAEGGVIHPKKNIEKKKKKCKCEEEDSDSDDD